MEVPLLGGDHLVPLLPQAIGSPTVKNVDPGNSLAVQWLELRASTAGGSGSIPSQGTKVLQAVRCGQLKKKNVDPILGIHTLALRRQLALRHGARYLTSLILSFLICTLETITAPLSRD